MIKLILASNSRWRKEILDMAGLKYIAVSSDIDENIEYKDPIEYVQELSRMKANSVASRFKEGIIISADTIGYIDNEKFEKAKSREEAFENMKKISGKISYTVTGVTIIDLYQNRTVTFPDVSEIYMKEISDEEINWYLDHEEGDKCASLFVKRINGDDKSIIGLPIQRVYDELKKLGYSISDLECK